MSRSMSASSIGTTHETDQRHDPSPATGQGSSTLGAPPAPLAPSQTLRVTVNLSARGTAALHQIVSLTGDSKTEAINKALQAYALIQEAQHQGGGALLQDDAASRPTQIRFY